MRTGYQKRWPATKSGKARRCPRCGAQEEAGCRFEQRGPLEGITTCECCQFMWGEGSTPGQGIEWWDDLSGWVRAPAGCMNVLSDLPGGPGAGLDGSRIEDVPGGWMLERVAE